MQPLGLVTGVLADDLTGACETGLQFFRAGAHSHVITSNSALTTIDTKPSDEHNTVWVLNTESRHETESDVIHETLSQGIEQLKNRFGAEQFYKKMDSTLRGQFAIECDALLKILELDCVLIAPAYPEEGRQTVGGYQMVHSIPVEQSAMNRDPLSPVSESHIPSLLGQTLPAESMGLIELRTVLDGAGPILNELQQLLEQGKQFIVVDACSRTDLEQIALAWVKAQNSIKCLPCGSAGLARALCKYWIDEPDRDEITTGDNVISMRPAPQTTDSLIVVVGSTTDTARSQLSYLLKQATLTETSVNWVRPQPNQLLDIAPSGDIVARLTEGLHHGGITVLVTNETEEVLRNTMSLGEEHHYSETGIHGKIQAQLKHWLSQAMLNAPQHQPTFVLVGGETALTICQGLHIDHSQLIDNVDYQVPIMKTTYQLNEQSHPTPCQLVTKSGDLGDTHLLWHVLQHLGIPTTTPSTTT